MKEFSTETVIALIVQIIVILIDRYIYLSKPTFKLKSDNNENNVLIFKCENSSYNHTLLAKFVFYFIQLILIHLFVFWFLANTGTYRLSKHLECTKNDIIDNRCNEVLQNPFLLIFYLMYCCYFICSALQVKKGWPKIEEIFIKKHANLFNKVISIVFFSIPFL